MKKILLILAAAALIAVPVIFNSCAKEDSPVDCSAEYLDVIVQGDKSCLDYKEDLQDYIDKDCSAIYEDAVQSLINTLDC